VSGIVDGPQTVPRCEIADRVDIHHQATNVDGHHACWHEPAGQIARRVIGCQLFQFSGGVGQIHVQRRRIAVDSYQSLLISHHLRGCCNVMVDKNSLARFRAQCPKARCSAAVHELTARVPGVHHAGTLSERPDSGPVVSQPERNVATTSSISRRRCPAERTYLNGRHAGSLVEKVLVAD
jgi:hypothetical protein